MTIPKIEVIEASSDVLTAAADTSATQHAEQNTMLARTIRLFTESCAYCVAAGSSGILASHAGCLITPAVTMLVSGGTSAIGHDPAVMTAVGAGINAAVVGGWYFGLGGRFMPLRTKAIVFGTALLGFATVTALNWQENSLMHDLYKAMCITEPTRPPVVTPSVQIPARIP